MKQIHILFFAMLTVSCLHAQDAFFSQYNSSPVALNPGNAGSTGRGRLTCSFRNQWPKIDGGYRTTNISYDHYFEKIHGGIAVNYYHDAVADGFFKSNGASAGYAFRMSLLGDRLIIQPGISFGFISVSIDTTKIITLQPETFPTTRKTAFDCSTGIMATTERFTFGFAAFHITQPDIGFFGPSKLPIRYNIYASAILGSTSQDFEKKFSFIPQVAYVRQGDFYQTNAGASVKFAHWQLGAAYRFGDAVIGMLAYNHSHLRVSYSYDNTISSLSNFNSGGSHEISLQLFMFPRKQDGLGFRDAGNYAF